MVALRHIFSPTTLTYVVLTLAIVVAPNILYFILVSIPKSILEGWLFMAPTVSSIARLCWDDDSITSWSLTPSWIGGPGVGPVQAPPLMCIPTTVFSPVTSTKTTTTTKTAGRTTTVTKTQSLFETATATVVHSVIHSFTVTEYHNRNKPSDQNYGSHPSTPPPPLTHIITTSVPAGAMTTWFQKTFSLPLLAKGSYLVTKPVVSALPEISQYRIGLLTLFVQHTSCGLGLCENWDEDVRSDMTAALDRIVPEEGPQGEDLYEHSAEGPDDMPVGDIRSMTWFYIWTKSKADGSERHTSRVHSSASVSQSPSRMASW